jgi:hypothetical protein
MGEWTGDTTATMNARIQSQLARGLVSIKARGGMMRAKNFRHACMSYQSGRSPDTVQRAPRIAIAAFAALLIAAPAHAVEAFAALQGAWSGTGNAVFDNGSVERLRCTAHYSGIHNDTLKLTIKCASAAAAITLTGSLDAEGGTVSGRWRESTYAMQGAATGVTEAGSVRLKISGGATGSLTLNVVGTSHSVALSATGATLRAVNIALHRN